MKCFYCDEEFNANQYNGNDLGGGEMFMRHDKKDHKISVFQNQRIYFDLLSEKNELCFVLSAKLDNINQWRYWINETEKYVSLDKLSKKFIDNIYNTISLLQ